jgi:hypothetical protein
LPNSIQAWTGLRLGLRAGNSACGCDEPASRIVSGGLNLSEYTHVKSNCFMVVFLEPEVPM